MASSPSPPPIIPISTTQEVGAQPTAPVTTPAFRVFLSRLTDSVNRSLANRRSWSELVDRSAFSRPESFSEAVSRARKNVAYFRVNYIALLALVLAGSLLSNPFSLLILLSLLAAWCFLYLFRPSDPPLVIFGRTFSDRETVGGLAVLSVFVLFLTSVGSLLISSLMIGAALIFAHGAFRVPEDLLFDDQEPGGASSGFLSFLGGAASSTVTAAGPAVAARV